MGDEIDQMIFLEEGGYVLETVAEDSREFHTEPPSMPMQQVSALSSDTIEEDEEGQQNQPPRRGDEFPGHRGPSGQPLVSTVEDHDDNDENDKLSAATFSAGSDSSIGIDTDLESLGITSDGDGSSQNKNRRKSKHVKFSGTPPGRGQKKPPLPPGGKHVQIRKADMRGAMDENTRYRHQIRRRLSSKVKQLFKKIEGDDNVSEADDESMEMAMHGRLMVQPSKRNIFPSDSSYSDEKEKKREETQYRLTTMRRKRYNQQKLPIPGMYEDTSTLDVHACCCSMFPNSDIVASAFLHWSFRSPFSLVFGAGALAWFALTFVFAFIYWIIGSLQGQCIGGVVFENSTSPFTDAYQMSWTTFSTVGYGLVYPATSYSYPDIHRCTLITMLTTFESFVGILFSSLCAAMMFAKIARVQSFAQVTFSDPIVIRYGTGVMMDDEDDDDDENGSKDPPTTRIPCPVLEFRIFNSLDSLPGGEIIDATLSMVASIDASQADSTLLHRSARRKRGKKKRGPKQKSLAPHLSMPSSAPPPPSRNGRVISDLSDHSSPSGSDQNVQQSITPRESPAKLLERGPAAALTRQPYSQQQKYPSNGPFQSKQSIRLQSGTIQPGQLHPGQGSRSRHGGRFGAMHHGHGGRWKRERELSQDSGSVLFDNLRHVSMRNTNLQAFEEDPSGKLIPKKILSKLDLETPDHPFFRRVWLVRHILDSNSLLLKPHVRQMLERNRGFWPKELNNYESIRASIEFDQILVSLSGTSNADANSVYAQHVYSMVDLNVGYRFVNALYRDPKDGRLLVDQTLINDVMEQAGGGGEPLHYFDADAFREMLVL